MTSRTSIQNTLVEHTLQLIEEVFGVLDQSCYAVRLWDGTTWKPASGTDIRCTIVLRHPGALRKMLSTPTELNMCECYLYGDVDLEGDIEAIMPVGEQLVGQPRSFWDKLRIGRQLLKLPQIKDCDSISHRRPKLSGKEHSVERDTAAVTHHYNVSNEFYATWLDRNMVYSCAVFDSQQESLDAAQERKLDYICRKLRLKPGDRMLDIGCGWGGLILHAVKNYGVEALGITLSEPQAQRANERIFAENLQGKCRVQVIDYRHLDKVEGFDKIASIGMVEHVGEDYLNEYFATAYRLLKPGGVFLNHGIGNLAGRPSKSPNDKPGFVRTYVFPDSSLPSITAVMAAAEKNQFEPRDLESLREHYAITLRHWIKRLEANEEDAKKEVGDVAYRVWRLYLASCAYWFAVGYISVYQTLLAKRIDGRSGLPLRRDDWYTNT